MIEKSSAPAFASECEMPRRVAVVAKLRPHISDLRLAALALGLSFDALMTIQGFDSGYESVSIARSLAETGRFANPYILNTGLTAHLAPLYPALLALFWVLAGGKFGACSPMRFNLQL